MHRLMTLWIISYSLFSFYVFSHWNSLPPFSASALLGLLIAFFVVFFKFLDLIIDQEEIKRLQEYNEFVKDENLKLNQENDKLSFSNKSLLHKLKKKDGNPSPK